jgi:hypothetical protein
MEIMQDHKQHRDNIKIIIQHIDAGRITTQLGTPRGRYDEYSSKFSLSTKPRFIVSRKKPNSRR